MGEPFTQFLLIKQTGSQAHRICLRLSHAQYDGVCVPRITEAFQAAYEGREVPPPPSPFCNYIQDAMPNNATRGHHEYWRSLLQGSTMSRIVSRDQPNYGGANVPVREMKRTIKLPALTAKNVTTATILKAAWAFVLTHITARNDVVFGSVISGRNAAVENVESIVAPCMNIVPVRVQLEPSWTALALLRRIQNQQVAGMAFESLGFREIVQHCTDWPNWTYYSSIVQHQNLKEDVSAGATLDRTKYKLGMLGSQDTLSDLTLISVPKGNDMVDVLLDFADDGTIGSDFVQRVLDLVCALAQTFTNNPNSALPSTFDFLGTISLPAEAMQHSTDSLQGTKLETTLRGLDRLELCDIADTLTRAWRIVLPQGRQSPSVLTLESSFYDSGGDLIALASLTAFLESEGYKVKLEELIARPTVGAQVALLGEQRKNMRRGLGSSEASSETLQGSASSKEDLRSRPANVKDISRKKDVMEEKRSKKGSWKAGSRRFARKFGIGRTN